MMEKLFSLPRTVVQKALKYWRKLWVRVFLMGVSSLLALGLTVLVETFILTDLGDYKLGNAVDRLLNIIANAMLAVTIFSLTVMVSVYRSSSSQWTPRVHRLIMRDTTTQNTLATFIGTYVFALVAIVLREIGVFSDDRSLIIFAVTILVLCLIIFSLIRWVLHLQTLGSLLHTTREVESITTDCFKDRLKTPCLGAKPLDGQVPKGAEAVLARQSGYIQRIYPEAMNAAAGEAGVEIFLPEAVGSFVFTGAPIAYVKGDILGEEKDDLIDEILDALEVDDQRVYDQDPRFGLIVMGEIASKALSPGINDPGTAIDIVTRLGRLLSYYRQEEIPDDKVSYPRLHIPPLSPQDLIEDGFSTVARDGANLLEVQMILQKVLGGLMRHPDPALRDAARGFAKQAEKWAQNAMKFDGEWARLKRAIAEEADTDNR